MGSCVAAFVAERRVATHLRPPRQPQPKTFGPLCPECLGAGVGAPGSLCDLFRDSLLKLLLDCSPRRSSDVIADLRYNICISTGVKVGNGGPRKCLITVAYRISACSGRGFGYVVVPFKQELLQCGVLQPITKYVSFVSS